MLRITESIRVNSLAIVIILLLPLVILGLQNTTTQPSVWIVYTDSHDGNIQLAAQTFTNELKPEECVIRETTLNYLEMIPLHSDAIVLIGHGQEDGLEVSQTVLPWVNVSEAMVERRSQISILLACDSPSNLEFGIYGFSGMIDAEAGALLAAWHVKRLMNPHSENIPSSKIVDVQHAMKHPLESYVYFVHGYHGNNSQFLDLIDTLTLWGSFAGYDGYYFYSYFDDYSSVNVAHGASIEEYAINFRNHLLYEHPRGTQIDIVAHSMGGLIARQMLMTERQTLESYGVEVGRVITLGTPHLGTRVADYGLGMLFTNILDLFYNEKPWATQVFVQMGTSHEFITTLNADPMSYSSGIEWYTVSGISNSPWAIIMTLVHLDANDVPVANGRAHLSFATQVLIEDIDHNVLIEDPLQRTYTNLSDWLAGGIDSDGDTIIDAEEKYVYYTDQNDTDSDNDALSDYDEIFIHGTNPNALSTDGDILSDSQEIAWGYDPLDTDNPIDAQELTYSAWQVNGVTGYVRANHWTAMDYVKVYAKYKNSLGYWTSYFYVGTDYTPTYYGDYYVSWSLLQGYVQMQVNVQAYAIEWDPAIEQDVHIYLGSDQQYVTLPGGGGGGGPLPE